MAFTRGLNVGRAGWWVALVAALVAAGHAPALGTHRGRRSSNRSIVASTASRLAA